MAKIELTDNQLSLIQIALDFYARIGIGQFDHIKDHPTFQNHVYNSCIPKREPVVGDRTHQGEILKIENGKALISGSVKNGKWNSEYEWKKIEDVKLSTDFNKYHDIRDRADKQLSIGRNILYGENLSQHGSWGIYNPNVDESCREAFNMVQVIRHEFWKRNPNRSNITVDSSVDPWIKNKIKVELDEKEK